MRPTDRTLRLMLRHVIAGILIGATAGGALAQSGPLVGRAADGATKPSSDEVYASALNGPFGMAFFPSGNDPQWVYVANADRVVRFPYATGDRKATGKPQTVAQLPHGYGHSTRDIVFSAD